MGLNGVLVAAIGILLFLPVPARAAALSIPQAADWTAKIAFVALFAILFVGYARKAKS
jgi:hypothetical protein